jgi:hypothetical protein
LCSCDGGRSRLRRIGFGPASRRCVRVEGMQERCIACGVIHTCVVTPTFIYHYIDDSTTVICITQSNELLFNFAFDGTTARKTLKFYVVRRCSGGRRLACRRCAPNDVAPLNRRSYFHSNLKKSRYEVIVPST